MAAMASVTLHLALLGLAGTLSVGALHGASPTIDEGPVIELIAADSPPARHTARASLSRPASRPRVDRLPGAPGVPGDPSLSPGDGSSPPSGPPPGPAEAPVTLDTTWASAESSPGVDPAPDGDVASASGSLVAATDSGMTPPRDAAMAPPGETVLASPAGADVVGVVAAGQDVAAAVAAGGNVVGAVAAGDPGQAAAPVETSTPPEPASVAAAEAVPARSDRDEPLVTHEPEMDVARLDAVASNPSVSARAAGAPFVGRREVFEFLLDHPDFATHVTRVLRVARYRIWRTDAGLFVDDGWGATGQMFVARAVSGRRVLYARGEFQHKLLPVITGEAVVTITYEAQPAPDGRDLLVADISSQLRIDGPFGELVAKLASGVATEKAEKESRRLVHIFARVLKALDERPAAVYASLLERPDVPRRELEQFRVLLKLP